MCAVEVNGGYALFEFGITEGKVNAMHLVYPCDHQSINVTIEGNDFESIPAIYDNDDLGNSSIKNEIPSLDTLLANSLDELVSKASIGLTASQVEEAKSDIIQLTDALKRVNAKGLRLVLGILGSDDEGEGFGLPGVVILAGR